MQTDSQKPAPVIHRTSRDARSSEDRPITTVTGGLLVFLVALVLMLGVAPLARAASSDIAISFPADPIRIEPGGSTTVVLRVANVGKKPIRVALSASQVKLMDNGRTQFLPQPDPLFAGSTRITPERVQLDAGESKGVKVQITAPKELRPDDYFLGILATPDVPAGQIRTVNAVGALIVLSVPGDRKTGLAAEFVDLPGLVWAKDVNAVVRVRNTGKNSLKFTTDSQISGFVAPRPKDVREVPHLLPRGLSRDVPVHWSSWLGIGRYTVRTVILYNKTSQSSAQVVLTRTVWVVSPWWLALPAAIIVVVVLLVWRRSRRMRRLRAQRSLAPES